MAARQLRISIPEPCSEGWNNMLPVDEQRSHCTSCNRVLTDFSQMSDDELALFFIHSKGKLCGHFSKSQLDRPIAIPKEKPKKKYWLNALWLLPLSWFAKPAQAQSTTPVIMGKPPVCVNTSQQQDPVQAQKPAQDSVAVVEHKLRCTVVDGDGKPIENAVVKLMVSSGDVPANYRIEEKQRATTDKKGMCMITLPDSAALAGGRWYVQASADDFMNSVQYFKAGIIPGEMKFMLRDDHQLLDGVVHMREH